MLQQLESTKIINSFYGWKGNTTITKNGYDWDITTMKRHSGLIVSNAQAGTATKGEKFIGHSFTMFADPSITLDSFKGKATEKTIREAHLKALCIFEEMAESGTLPERAGKDYEIKTGQILFLNGYGQSEYSHERKAVYEIKKTSLGTSYLCVNLDTLALTQHDHVRNIKDKFGIGIYYKEGDVIDEETLNNVLIEAKEKEASQNRKNQSESILNDAAREAKIEEGEKLVNIPKDAQSVIIAKLEENESDSMTDYWGSKTVKTIYLAFSSHKKNLFPEMRKAAKNAPETDFLADAPKEWEQKQNWSMGAGYFLGENRYSGWKIKKDAYLDFNNENVKNSLYIAAAEGRYFANVQQEQEAVITIAAGNYEVIQYSEKAIAVKGDTRAIKDQLKSLGGRFNPRLTDPSTGEKFVGWIFKKSSESDVLKLLNA